MTRSIALSPGFADSSYGAAHSYAPATAPASSQTIFGRILDRLLKARQRDLDREIEHYLAERGYDHFTDSIERDIEYRFLGRQPQRF